MALESQRTQGDCKGGYKTKGHFSFFIFLESALIQDYILSKIYSYEKKVVRQQEVVGTSHI